jgi:hypothetical protein
VPSSEVSGVIEGARVAVVARRSNSGGELDNRPVWKSRTAAVYSKRDGGTRAIGDLDRKSASTVADAQGFYHAPGYDQRFAGFRVKRRRADRSVPFGDTSAQREDAASPSDPETFRRTEVSQDKNEDEQPECHA